MNQEWNDVSDLKIFTVLLVLFTVVSSVPVLCIKAADVEGTVLSQVEEAEAAIDEAYVAVFEADMEGADVSELLKILDLAGEYLASARMNLRKGDFERAASNASLCIQSLEGSVENANILKNTVIKENDKRYWTAIGGSAVGVIMAIGGCWLSWKWFKKHYQRTQ